ncbi:hypothetical protein MHK_006779 [Candidatus Magnetomorum sp. HK-1]|nr:hypothetical protein MHK_006779 [Candidatus Magnetomorum sp. HK-1]
MYDKDLAINIISHHYFDVGKLEVLQIFSQLNKNLERSLICQTTNTHQ